MKKLFPLALLLLTSCAPTVWHKDGGTLQEFNTAKYECLRDVQQSNLGGGVSGALWQQAFLEQCFNAHGYYKVAKK